MPKCTRGTIKKTVSGTIKIKIAGRTIRTIDLTDEEGTDQWNTCHCEQGTYQENACITASHNTDDESVTGSREVTQLVTFEWDLSVDTERSITNCDYDCITEPPGKGEYF